MAVINRMDGDPHQSSFHHSVLPGGPGPVLLLPLPHPIQGNLWQARLSATPTTTSASQRYPLGDEAICQYCHYLALFMAILWGTRPYASTATTLLNSWQSSGGPGHLPVLPLPRTIHGNPLEGKAICLYCHYLTPSKVNLW